MIPQQLIFPIVFFGIFALINLVLIVSHLLTRHKNQQPSEDTWKNADVSGWGHYKG